MYIVPWNRVFDERFIFLNSPFSPTVLCFSRVSISTLQLFADKIIQNNNDNKKIANPQRHILVCINTRVILWHRDIFHLPYTCVLKRYVREFIYLSYMKKRVLIIAPYTTSYMVFTLLRHINVVFCFFFLQLLIIIVLFFKLGNLLN